MKTYQFIKKAILTVCLFCLLSNSGLSQCAPVEQDSIYYNQIISLQEFSSKSDRPFSGYLRHLQLTIHFLVTEDVEILEELEQLESEIVDEIESKCEDPYQSFYLAEIKLRNSFLNINIGNELTAAWQIKQAYSLLKDNTENYPQFIPQYKTMGLLHIMLGSIPEKYQWVINLLGMEGDIVKGMEELKKVTNQPNIYQQEAEIINALIHAFILNNTKKASAQTLKIYSEYPQNELLAYIAIAIELKNHNAKGAQKLLDNIVINRNPLLHFQAGEIYLQTGKYTNAEKEFLKFIEVFRGSNFIKAAYYKLFLASWLENDGVVSEEVNKYYSMAKSNGQTIIEVDKQAESMTKNDFYPHTELMKARLFTDGGLYDKADSILVAISENELKSSKDKKEFYYRRARLFDLQNNKEKALQYYNKVLSVKFEGEYIIPNSALQIAYYYLEKQDTIKAKMYFQKTLEYSNYQYERSIKNKAKAGLKLIE